MSVTNTESLQAIRLLTYLLTYNTVSTHSHRLTVHHQFRQRARYKHYNIHRLTRKTRATLARNVACTYAALIS